MRKRWTRLLAWMTVPLMCGCQSFFFRVVNTGDTHVAALTATYDTARDLKLDVYRPAHVDATTPVALFFYGGSWRTGTRTEYAFVGQALASRGILAIVADYRKFPQVRFPDFEYDAARAARWTFDHAADYGGDPRRIVVVGHSAGAQMAALLATDARYLASVQLKPRDFAGAVGIAGPYDFLPLTDPKLVEVFGAERDWPASQPIRFVDGDEPPFLLLQGSGDRIVEPANSVKMDAKLRAAGDAVTYKPYDGPGHFRILAALRYTSLAPTLDDVAAFVHATPAVGH